MKSETHLRALTAILLILSVLAALLFAPKVALLVLLAGVVAISGWELSQTIAYKPLCVVGIALLVVGVWLLPLCLPQGMIWAMLWGILWLVLAPFVLVRFAQNPKRSFGVWSAFVFGALLLMVFAWSITELIAMHRLLLLMSMSLVWASDTGAYFAGGAWGRHKLAPAISPGKTWEGLLGGMMASVAAMTLWAVLWPALGGGSGYWCLFAVGVALLGALGDLLESVWKRSIGIKDSGSLLPGHGGVLDRIDGLLPVLPYAALVLVWFFHSLQVV